jgi:eIF3 subunit 6 N terminal domain
LRDGRHNFVALAGDELVLVKSRSEAGACSNLERSPGRDEAKIPTMAEYDLTRTIIPYIDRHLALPLLERLLDTSLFPHEDILLAQYELTSGTSMIDLIEKLHEQLYSDQDLPQGISPEIGHGCPSIACYSAILPVLTLSIIFRTC